MQKLITFRFAMPAIVIVAIITLLIIAFALLTTHHTGTAWGVPQ